MNVKANLVADIDECGRAPGDFMWLGRMNEDGVIVACNFICPCGCGREAAVMLEVPANTAAGETPTWWWDGDMERPTLRPSILWRLPDGQGNQIEHWHGWLTAGEFVTC